MRWITEEEYHALNNGMSKDKITSGTNVTESTSGQVLESKAGPHTLEQKDYQGNAIVHDIMTKEGLNEMETSNKTTTYGEVNSTITERAPNINKTYQQNQSYSESYQNKTENIQAQNYERNIETPQFTRTQNNLNLNVPHNLNVQASESITRNIGTRNMSVGTQEMWGQTYSFNGGTIQRFGDVTIIRGDYVQFRANSFILGPGSSDAAPTPVVPRRATQQCILAPNPAPQNILGTCDYYQWRYNDFVARHQHCRHSVRPPDYYLDYGLKYCQMFMHDLYPIMGPQGKLFITQTKLNLQLALEAILKENPQIELNSNNFRNAVFDTHKGAYEKAGIAQLNPPEQVLIGFLPAETFVEEPKQAGTQALDVLTYVVENEYAPKDMLEDIQNYIQFTYFYAPG